MKSRLVFFPVFVLLAIMTACQPTNLGGGSDVGHGGENPPADHLAAWFVGKKQPITICLETSADFGVSLPVARKAIEGAFEVWSSYIESRKVHSDLPESLQPSTTIQWSSSCYSEVDLVFYLGIQNEEISRTAEKLHRPTAFAHRLFFDHDKPRGRGFIWLASHAQFVSDPPFPDWHRPGTLLRMLLHELGHVYGNGHVPGTIMDAQINRLLWDPPEPSPAARIEYCRELVPCRNCEYEEKINLINLPHKTRVALGNFAPLLPEQQISVRLFRNEKGEFSALSFGGEPGSNYALSAYLLDKGPGIRGLHTGEPVFKIVHGQSLYSYSDTSYLQQSTAMRALPFGSHDPQLLEDTGLVVVSYNVASCWKKAASASAPVRISLPDGPRVHFDIGLGQLFRRR